VRPSQSFRMVDEPIEPDCLKQALVSDRAGASVCFEGWVRDHNEGETVTALEYEAHAAIASTEGDKILGEARARFDLISAFAEHRVGTLQIGDCAVWVGVCSAHRGAAFDACRYIIDEIKHRVPIWKKEHYAGGHSGWINCATAGSQASPTESPRS